MKIERDLRYLPLQETSVAQSEVQEISNYLMVVTVGVNALAQTTHQNIKSNYRHWSSIENLSPLCN